MPKTDYSAHAKPLIEAIDIAVDALQQFPPPNFGPGDVAHCVSVYREWRQKVEHPAPEFRNKHSLKYHQEHVLTYFLEASGPTVDYFWRQVQQKGLPYQRVNRLAKILKRNRLISYIEYELVVDVLVPYQQQGLLSSDEAAALARMIGEFEDRKSHGD